MCFRSKARRQAHNWIFVTWPEYIQDLQIQVLAGSRSHSRRAGPPDEEQTHTGCCFLLMPSTNHWPCRLTPDPGSNQAPLMLRPGHLAPGQAGAPHPFWKFAHVQAEVSRWSWKNGRFCKTRELDRIWLTQLLDKGVWNWLWKVYYFCFANSPWPVSTS